MSSFRDKYKKPLESVEPVRKAERARQVSPRRQFSEESFKTPPSQRMHNFFVVCYWLVPLLVIVAILATGIFITLKLQPQPAESDERENYQPSFQSSFSSSSLSSMGQTQLLEAYVQAMGGRDVLQEMRSVRYEGTLSDSGKEREFQLIVLSPDMGALVFEPGSDTSERYVLNGRVAWQVIEAEGGREVRLLGEDQTEGMIRTCRLHDPLRELALGGKGAILFIVETTYDGVEALKVTKEQIDGSVIVCYLDRETLYLLATEDSFYADGGRRFRKITFSDYRMTSGVVEPFQTETYMDGELFNRTSLNSIRINPGVMSSLFEVPEELAR